MLFNIYSISLSVATIITLIVAFFTYNKHNVPGSKYFAFLMFGIAEWTLSNTIEYHVQNIDLKILLSKFSYLGIVSVAPLFLLFTLFYTRRIKQFKLSYIFKFWFVPIIVLLFVFTNDYHFLHWKSYSFVNTNIGIIVQYQSGVSVWICAAYSYMILLLSVIILIKYTSFDHHIYKIQLILILLSMIFPWISNFVYLIGINPYINLDFTPIAFSISGITLFYAIIKMGLFEIIPNAIESLFKSMSDAVIVVDENYRIIDFNPSAENAFLIDGTIGNSIFKVIPQIQTENFLTDKFNKNFEIFINTNSQIWYDVIISPIMQNPITRNGFLIVSRDITKIKQNEALLLESETKLKELNASKDKFFGIIAHDLKSPLLGLMNILELLTKDLSSFTINELKEIILNLKNSFDQVYSLLENLLQWSRIQRGNIENIPDNIPVMNFVNHAFGLLNQNANSKEITLIHRIKDEHRIYVDYNMICTVFRNIISNSIKFTNPKGIIEIFVYSENKDFITFAFKDNGTGMTDRVKEKLFKIEEKILSVGTSGEKGTGLGLILCKEFIELNNGTITLESKENIGTTFYIKLPKHKIQ